jgi:hypothetical protein
MRVPTISFIALLLAAPTALVSSAQAQCAKDNEKTVLNGEAVADPTSFNDFVSNFESRMGVSIGESCNGVTFYKSSTVMDNISINHPDFPKKLQIAYERGMFNLQARIIMDLYGRQTVTKITELFNDDSTNARAWPAIEKEIVEAKDDQSKISKIFDKTLDLMEKKLDNELIKEGVSAQKINQSSITEKKLTFKDNFLKESLRKAVGDIKGLVPVHTKVFTGSNSKGNFVTLGIIAVQSQKTVAFANSIAKQQEAGIKGTPNNIKDILPSTNLGYLNEVGLRFVYDEEGSPTIISYAQWSVTAKTDSASRYERLKELAMDTAADLAQSNITEFVKSSISVSEKNIVQDISEQASTRVTQFENQKNMGSEEKIEQIAEIIDKSFKNASSTATMKLRGSTELKRWEQIDPNTQVLHLGAVRKFSFKELANQNAIANQSNSVSKAQPTEQKSSSSVSRDSKPVNRASDF